MVSDKPPRRSRSGKTPVTIDLAAEETKAAEPPAVAEPVRSTDTDAVIETATPEDAPAQSTPADGPAAAPDTAVLPPSTDHGETATNAPENDDRAAAPVSPAATSSSALWTTSAKSAEPPNETAAETAARPFPDPADEPQAPDSTRPAPKTVDPLTSPAKPEAVAGNTVDADARREIPAAAAPVVTPPAAGPKTSAMIASGILGGIVALALAGSMQYAGYLPGLDPQQRGGASSAALEDLRREVASLRSGGSGGQDLTARVAALEKSSGNTGASGQMTAALQQMKSDIDGLKSALQAQGASDAELNRQMDTLAAKVNQPGREQAVARALAAAALKAATERGGSFEAELATYAGVAKGDPAIEGLRPYASNGVPTRTELSRRLPAAANAILDAAHQPVEGQSITERLLASAMRVVRVRPVGEVEGETAEAIVARMEERVKNGDLKAASAEWSKLPETSRQASAPFKQALDARIAVDDLMNGTLTRAMASAGANG
ncbi:Uncharacterized conserved protein [Rhizobium sp. RU35A]|uniref:hypothetical protein n=1 Tax=Rhizobium sp. RU35A TaxID=1907414 RepID=UPI000954D2A5|nr:hypothetical protein [Rhizobium sp. RU35A]SIQ67527.1 Uncharacterized conserved protein [Rhizobium sp. RU35A]